MIIINWNLNLNVFLLIIKNKITNKGPNNEEKSFKLVEKIIFTNFIEPPLNSLWKLS